MNCQQKTNFNETDFHSGYTVLGTISDSDREHVVVDARSKKEEKNDKISKKSLNKKRPRKNSGKLMIIMITILCFSLTAILADVFLGNADFSSYTSVFKKSNTEKYFSYWIVHLPPSNDKAMAYKNATTIQAEGGAGYVIKCEDNYYVALNAYESKSEADKIAKNNHNSDIYELKIKDFKSNVFPEKTASSAEKTKTLHKEAYRFLYQEANAMSNGTFSSNEILKNISAQKLRFDTYIALFEESTKGLDDTIVIEYKVQLLSIKSIFENLLNCSKNLVGEMRYYSVFILCSFSAFSEKFF